MHAPTRHLLSGLLAAAAVGATGAAQGGYFPTAWGWSALALLLAAAAILIVGDRVDPSRLDLAFLVGLASLVAWALVSIAWSESAPRTVHEVERGVVYVAGAGALLLLARRGGAAWLAGGVLAAATGIAAYALATRLFPDRFEDGLELGRQLSRPVGYWNALGILVAIGIVLALGLAASGPRAVRVPAAAALPVLATTLYLTFSRGAPVALAVGLVTAFAVDRARLRLAATALALAPLPALSVALASRSEPLVGQPATLAEAARAGHRLAVAVLLLTAASALAGLALGRLPATIAIAPRTRRLVSMAVGAVGAAAVLALLVAAGGPVAVAERAYDSFRAPLPASGGTVEGRLFSVSGNGRADYWRVALDAYAENPVLGSGAGTYELHWNRERPTAFATRDAHNLYLETLAELGPVGLLLLLCALGVPLLALARARATSVGAAAAGGYAAYLAHAALDWDWEMPAVTLAGISCAAAMLVAARRAADERALTGRIRAVGLVAAAAVGAFAFVAYVGNSAVARSSDAAAEGNFERAGAQARRATRWTPWAAEAWEALAEAELAQGREREALAAYREAVERDPRDWRPWYGVALVTEGEERAAAVARARRLNPRSAELDTLQAG